MTVTHLDGRHRPAPDWQVSMAAAAARVAADAVLGADPGTLVHEATAIPTPRGQVLVLVAWSAPGRVAVRPRSISMWLTAHHQQWSERERRAYFAALVGQVRGLVRWA